MSDAKNCQFCGGEIRFRIIRGICVPLHYGSTDCIVHGRSGQPKVCHQTRCPYCHQTVYFVRHNDGAVWFDELGQPWDKHACFNKKEVPNSVIHLDSYYLGRIRKIMHCYLLDQGERYAHEPCFEIHVGCNREPSNVWHVFPNIPAEQVFHWRGRYCYISQALRKLVFLNGQQYVITCPI